jgi:AraC-like DNA-binding protein
VLSCKWGEAVLLLLSESRLKVDVFDQYNFSYYSQRHELLILHLISDQGFFIPDEFIRDFINEVKGEKGIGSNVEYQDFRIKKIESNPLLASFFNSMGPFFSQFEKPADILIKTKLKELLLYLLTSAPNQGIANYLKSIFSSEGPSIEAIMNGNFYYDLSVPQYAELCHRSVSTFKREFQDLFHLPPGKWIKQKRLEYASVLLSDYNLSIAQVAYKAGFKNASHFSRLFKSTYDITPRQFRMKL